MLLLLTGSLESLLQTDQDFRARKQVLSRGTFYFLRQCFLETWCDLYLLFLEHSLISILTPLFSNTLPSFRGFLGFLEITRPSQLYNIQTDPSMNLLLNTNQLISQGPLFLFSLVSLKNLLSRPIFSTHCSVSCCKWLSPPAICLFCSVLLASVVVWFCWPDIFLNRYTCFLLLLPVLTSVFHSHLLFPYILFSYIFLLAFTPFIPLPVPTLWVYCLQPQRQTMIFGGVFLFC